MLVERCDPAVQCLFVVFAQIFDIADLEAGALGGVHHFGYCQEFAIGEDIAVYERWSAPNWAGPPGDPVIQEEPAGKEHRVGALEVLAKILVPDVFTHSYAGDFMKARLLRCEVAEVHQVHFTLRCGALRAHAPHCVINLLFTERNATRDNAVLRGGMQDKTAPAAADIK